MCDIRPQLAPAQVVPASMLKPKASYIHAAERKRECRWNDDNTCKCLWDERKNMVRIFPSIINVRPDKEQGKLLQSHCTASQAELQLGPMTGARGSQETAPDAWKWEVDSWVMYRRGFLNMSTCKGGACFYKNVIQTTKSKTGREKLQTKIIASIKKNAFQ